MKLFSVDLEMKAIRSICDYGASVESSKSDIGALLLRSLTQEHFHYEPTATAFKRIESFAKRRGRILTFSQLVADPAVDEEFRIILKEKRRKPAADSKDAEHLVDVLDSYRKNRVLYYRSKANLEALQLSKVDIDKLLEENADAISKAREAHFDKPLSILGDGGAYEDLLEAALDPTDDVLYKTGFNEIDDKNGGVPAEGVLLLAGTTSGGKSVIRMNMCCRMYKLNQIDVATVSLEMQEKKETRRLLSFLTGIPFWKFTKKALTSEEREQCRVALRKFHSFGKKNKCKYALMCPTRGMTMTQLLMHMRPYGFKVIAIDYAGLLEGMGGEDQWRKLSEAVREAKIFSTENHCLVIILCQLDSADDHIRYAKGMLEHADGAWIWNYSKAEQRELHLIPIRQLKARDQELFNFDVAERFDVMRVDNVDAEEGGNSADASREPAGPTNAKSKKSSSKTKDEALEEDADVKYEETEVL